MMSTNPFYYKPAAYTDEQLARALPETAVKLLVAHGGSLRDKDAAALLLVREPNGTLNRNALEAALAAVDRCGLTLTETICVRTELEGLLAAEGAVSTNRDYDAALRQTFAACAEARPATSLVRPSVAPEEIGLPAREFGAEPSPGIRRVQVGGMLERAGMTQSLNLDSAAFDRTFGGDYYLQQLGGAPGAGTAMSDAAPFVDRLPLGVIESRQPDTVNGSLSQAFRRMPDWLALGITRPAGEPTEAEIAAFKGTVLADNSAVTTKNFWRTGACLVTIDVIPQLMAFIPPAELKRIGVILQNRSKKSDLDHSRQVMSGGFTVVNPMIGEDPSTHLHMDHPLLGQVPFTALTAVCVFPLMENDPNQKAMVEAAQRGKLQNLSITFNYEHVCCGLCGEMRVESVQRANGVVTGFTVNPTTNRELFMSADSDEWDYYYYKPEGVMRVEAQVAGGYLYRGVQLLGVSEEGVVQIEPVPEASFAFKPGAVFMTAMSRYWGFFGGAACRFHGRVGMRLRDGRAVVGMFVNLTDLINVAAVDAGAIGDAMLVLDPGKVY